MASLASAKERLDLEKQAAARAALEYVRGGMKLGLGTGSTAAHFIALLGDRIRQSGLKVVAVASSNASEALAREAGVPLIEPSRGLRLDLAIDGADEIAPDLSLIKGNGGAMLREKVLARAARYFLVIADSSKRVDRLGATRVPVEATAFALPWVMDEIVALGGEPVQRMHPGPEAKPVLTDQGNPVLDCLFRSMDDPGGLSARLDHIPGVVGHGLFIGYARAVLIAESTRILLLRAGQPPADAAAFAELP
jgi:ribose 5-phosphate isomerase A